MVNSPDGKPALWDWEDEGGALASPRHDPVLRRPRRQRPPQDTPEGCMSMAAADMERAGLEAAGWPTMRFEHSAVMWARRAKMLSNRALG